MGDDLSEVGMGGKNALVYCLKTSLILLMLLMAGANAQSWELKVCADQANLPYSNKERQGFENRIAEILAGELKAKLTYVWFDRNHTWAKDLLLLEQGQCDLFMGVADGQDPFLTTISYYRSSYVFAYPQNSKTPVASFDDAILPKLKIAIQMPGGGEASPPAYALAKRGMVANVRHFFVDTNVNNPLTEVMTALNRGEVDLAIVWGPTAGYFAKQQTGKLKLVPVVPEIDPPFSIMVYSISIGVRQEDSGLRDRLNLAIARRWDAIQKVLRDFGVPLLDLPKPIESQR